MCVIMFMNVHANKTTVSHLLRQHDWPREARKCDCIQNQLWLYSAPGTGAYRASPPFPFPFVLGSDLKDFQEGRLNVAILAR